ncbi:MAG TPA: hypothetical protein VGZ00_10565 [Candidatus Baltobacteraceae bacterium]|nr:hypothetical protein [Candidatus Baltobacteraceae bacterium]
MSTMKSRASRGQALLETAVALPILLLAFFGVIWAMKEGTLLERSQLDVRYGGVLAAQSQAYQDYSLSTLYTTVDFPTAGPPTPFCGTPPPALIGGGSVGGGVTVSQQPFWAPQNAVVASCTGPRLPLTASLGFTRDYLIDTSHESVTVLADVPTQIKAMLGNSATTSVGNSAQETFYRSPDLTTLLVCLNENQFGSPIYWSLKSGEVTDTFDSSTVIATPLPFSAWSAPLPPSYAGNCNNKFTPAPILAPPTPEITDNTGWITAPPMVTPTPSPYKASTPTVGPWYVWWSGGPGGCCDSGGGGPSGGPGGF